MSCMTWPAITSQPLDFKIPSNHFSLLTCHDYDYDTDYYGWHLGRDGCQQNMQSLES